MLLRLGGNLVNSVCVTFIIVEVWYLIVKTWWDSRVCWCRVGGSVDLVLEFIGHIFVLIVTTWSGKEFRTCFIQIISKSLVWHILLLGFQISVLSSRIVAGFFYILFSVRNL